MKFLYHLFGKVRPARRFRFGLRVGFCCLAIAALTTTTAFARAGAIDRDRCTYNGIPLYGDVQIVQAFPDLKIQAVANFPDLNVQIVQNFPKQCGQWRFVEIFPDVKVQFVRIFPDLKVQFVNSFPGIPVSQLQGTP